MRRITYECCIRSGKRQKYDGEHALFNSSDVAIRTLDSKGPCSDGSIRINVNQLYKITLAILLLNRMIHIEMWKVIARKKNTLFQKNSQRYKSIIFHLHWCLKHVWWIKLFSQTNGYAKPEFMFL